MLRADLDTYTLPDAPGVYRFYQGDMLLYVGKATSLRDRVRSYFSSGLSETRGARVSRMIALATTVEWEETDSVLEALILEAALIKKHQPPINVREKDNSSFNYLIITKESFPRIVVVRGRELAQRWEAKAIRYQFGPFPQGGALKEAMKLVRRIFPYRDTCVPGAGKPCFNRQIGLCPGVCDGTVRTTEYGRTVRHIATLFSGKKRALIRVLEREMKALADAREFEAAARVKKQKSALEHIRDVALIRNDTFGSTGGNSSALRIEAYDVAHLAGHAVVGVMTVVEDGEAKPPAYRRFNIRGISNDDTAALAQILERRLAHTEWPLPKLIVVDGGKGQLHAARTIVKRMGLSIPLVSVLKDNRHKPKEILGDAPYKSVQEKGILLANAEAHRFALAFHRKKSRRVLTRITLKV